MPRHKFHYTEVSVGKDGKARLTPRVQYWPPATREAPGVAAVPPSDFGTTTYVGIARLARKAFIDDDHLAIRDFARRLGVAAADLEAREKAEPGTMQRLRPGESVTWSDPPQIGTEANEFEALWDRPQTPGPENVS